MTDTTTPQPAEHQLHEVIDRYLAAHDAHETDLALATFTTDATVVDENREYHGRAEIRTWLETAATGYSYTRAFISAESIDANTWVVTNRLEGNFPGGIVDLRYRFALRDQLIAQLVIAP